MSLLQKIDADMKQALKAGQKSKLTVLRGLKSELKYKQIDKGGELTDEEMIGVLSSVAKKHRESIEEFQRGGRQDLVTKEQSELEFVLSYLPQQLGEEQIREIIRQAIVDSGADSPQKLGAVMKLVMPQIKGQADGKLVNRLAAEMLAKKI
ncbi:MAG TPA: GatB/YqeY domain-containing protein [Candidatus Deferrimicrobium sp.]|nr:GatB/YqeY domain-containing protein [Candidatus Deferrimicrobium sp.]